MEGATERPAEQPNAAATMPAASTPEASTAASPTGRKREKRPRIDLDDSIALAKAAMQKAMKEVSDARRVGRNERRKKQRLIKKAGILSAEDLERIAVLKRCGLYQPSSGSSTAASSSAPSSDTSTAPASAASSPALAPAAPPPDADVELAADASVAGSADELDDRS